MRNSLSKIHFCWPLVITVILWGGNFVALKVVYRQLTPDELFPLRYCVMFLGLLLSCVVTRSALKYEKGDFWPIMYFGFVSMGIYLILFATGMKGSSAPEGALILALAPLMTAGGEMLTRLQPFSRKVLFGGIVAVAGVGLVVFGNGQALATGHLLGNAMVLCSAGVWAYSALLMRPLLQRYSALQLITLSFPGALPVVLVTLPALFKIDFGGLETWTWVGLAHIGLGSGVFGFTLFYEGVRQIGPARAVTYQYFTPVTTAIFAAPILGQPITPVQISGMAIVVTGLVLARRPQPLAELEPDPNP